MSTPISLIQMPNLVMEHILEYLEFPSILVLRKVCHDFRNFIDHTKLASLLTKIEVDVTPESIHSVLDFPWSLSWMYIDYVKKEEECLVKYKKDSNVKETTVKDEDFVTVFCKDFDIILRHQKTVLDKFSIRCSFDLTVEKSIMESVSKSLKSMNKPLQVKALHMIVNNQDNILTILPYIDPKSLEEIDIMGRSGNVINLDEIGQLEQWKQAKELEISDFQISGISSQNLEHFSSITFYFRPISTEELILLKEIFLCSPTLNIIEFHHHFEYTGYKPKLIEAFGQPFVVENNDEDSDEDGDEDGSWFFRIPDTDQFLKITNSHNYIYFVCIEQSDVPQNARISS